jgi:hypothetical protein
VGRTEGGKRRLTEPGLTIFKVLIFGAATFALWASGQGMLAVVFGVLAAINLIAARMLGPVSWPKRA